MLKRALISVSKKDGITEFARGLANLGLEIVSTGGTARVLREAGITVKDISELTGFPEILDGRVKTLHPKVHGGLLGIRDNPNHQRQMAEQQINPIDLVVVNLYPFEETAAKLGIEFGEVIENIDIGGPSMIRSAAKNFRDVGVVVDPADYDWVLDELKQSPSGLSLESRFALARKAFNLTAGYDTAIASHLFRRQHEAGNFELKEGFPQKLLLSLDKVSDLRYGENPHQRAAFYRENSSFTTVLPNTVQLQGKELSFNNLLDLNAAFQLSAEFESPCAVIIKHTNPCGVAISIQSLADAYVKARECDPLSAFGSVLGFNRTVDKETAREIALTFVEAVIAPDFSSEALSLLTSKKNLRLLRYPDAANRLHPLDYKRVEGGLLVQEADRRQVSSQEWKVVTKRSPAAEEVEALLFAWKVVKHVKSNAIVYAGKGQTVGIGAGQMSRVDSAQIGISKARLPIQGCVLASDAFFPFRDGVDLAAQAGIRAVIQPGGSLKDPEVVEAANEHGMAMVFTGVRHFKH
ncbi:MAG: bifunctional phosphoribosylaminoimidazolecarboxamide formyltransferase/IMP cyclohydrolase [Acidobacteria bacterium]|nr:bifunctional phosphoribosylaminoimidazolecarboxamide formyltransferase/IMP cyclohydrolase [Acidobacteriota bacterium]